MRAAHQLASTPELSLRTKHLTAAGKAESCFIVASLPGTRVMWLSAEPHPLWSLHGIADANTVTGLQRAQSAQSLATASENRYGGCDELAAMYWRLTRREPSSYYHSSDVATGDATNTAVVMAGTSRRFAFPSCPVPWPGGLQFLCLPKSTEALLRRVKIILGFQLFLASDKPLLASNRPNQRSACLSFLGGSPPRSRKPGPFGGGPGRLGALLFLVQG